VPLTLRFELFPDALEATADFYVRVLGFEVVDDHRSAGADYLSLQRDQVRVGAVARPGEGDRRNRVPPTGVELVLEVDDLEQERDRVGRAGWPVTEDIARRPWGLRDFRLVDPSGYYLRITERCGGP